MSKTTKVITFSLSLIFKVIVYVFVIFLIIKVSVFSYKFGYSVMENNAVAVEPGIDMQVNISEDMNVDTLLDLLENKGLILDKNVAYVQYKFFGYKIVPGEYNLNNSKSSKDILSIIDNGPKEDKQ